MPIAWYFDFVSMFTWLQWSAVRELAGQRAAEISAGPPLQSAAGPAPVHCRGHHAGCGRRHLRMDLGPWAGGGYARGDPAAGYLAGYRRRGHRALGARRQSRPSGKFRAGDLRPGLRRFRRWLLAPSCSGVPMRTRLRWITSLIPSCSMTVRWGDLAICRSGGRRSDKAF